MRRVKTYSDFGVNSWREIHKCAPDGLEFSFPVRHVRVVDMVPRVDVDNSAAHPFADVVIVCIRPFGNMFMATR